VSRLVAQITLPLPYVVNDLRCELVWEDIRIAERATWVQGGPVIVSGKIVRAVVAVRLWDDHEPGTGDA
jgi:hypothetical protein